MSAHNWALGQQILISVGLAAIAIILHELAHGYMAWALGDRTAKDAGRLSPNPLRHVDRFGTLILPGFLLVSQLLTVGRVLFMFGWAKPVPVNPARFKYPRQMMAVVALAGPVMNFCLAYAGARALLWPGLTTAWAQILESFIVLNLVLGLFNLVPLPPLDGGRIMVGVLPLKLARLWAGLEKYGIVVVLILVAAPALLRQEGIYFDPLRSTLYPVVGWAFDHLLEFAGVISHS